MTVTLGLGWGLGFGVLGFRVWGFRVSGLGFGFWVNCCYFGFGVGLGAGGGVMWLINSQHQANVPQGIVSSFRV